MKRRQNKHRLKFYLKRNILKVGSVSIGPSTPSKVILSQDKD
jgi:hypothetical protein